MARMERFRWWVIEFVANAVVFASFLSYRYFLPPEDSEWTPADKWSFVVPSVAASLSFLGMLASVFQRDEDSVCRIESILVWAVTALWTIAIIMMSVGPLQDRELVAYESFIGLHPNLYFFSLFALIVTIILMASWFNQYIHGEGLEHSTSTQWILLGALSFLSMLSGISFRDSLVVEEVIQDLGNGTMGNTTIASPICESESYRCERATLTIVLSAASAGISCVMVPWKAKNRICQSDVAIGLFISWLCGVAFITFGSGPGAQWGTLHFATYINLFLCLDIIIQSTAGFEGIVDQQSRRSSAIGRGAIFEAAYTQLERMNIEGHSTVDRSDSYRSLFESVTVVPGSDDEAQDYVSGIARAASLNQQYEQSQVDRLELWCILLIESCVNAASLIPNLSDPGQRSPAEKLVLTLPCLSIVVSCCGYATCMRKKKRARIVQAVSVLLVLVVWATAIPILSYSVDAEILGYESGFSSEAKRDANLFSSTWISVIVVILLITNIFRASVVTSDWVLLATFSFALMGSSLVYFNTQNPDFEFGKNGKLDASVPQCSAFTQLQNSTCRKTTIAFYLGIFSGLASMVMAVLFRCGPLLHCIMACILVIFWSVAVAYITFARTEGAAAGVLYFSCWAGALLTIDLVTMNFVRLVRDFEKRRTQSTPNEEVLDLSNIPQHESSETGSAPDAKETPQKSRHIFTFDHPPTEREDYDHETVHS